MMLRQLLDRLLWRLGYMPRHRCHCGAYAVSVTTLGGPAYFTCADHEEDDA